MARNGFFLYYIYLVYVPIAISVCPSQEGEATPTPSETPLSPEATPEPLEIPEIESESSFQSFSLQSSTELGGDWAAQVNLSDTVGESFKPQIAADGFGNLHIVWRETVNGNQEIFYTWIDVDKTTQSLPVNVSNSPSFHSHAPQIVVDSTGIAHIVWQEEDNDHGDDYEIHYSNCQTTGNEEDGYVSSCSTTPAILSNGDACGSFVGDWKSTDPSIGIDGNGNLMVAWMSFEPSSRLYTMFSLWSAFGTPPANRTGCNLATGSYYYPVVAGDSNGDFHLLRMNASTSIFYSKYSGGSWSANQTLGTGWLPVVHVDSNNKLHAAWWNTNAPPKYRSKESASSTWSSTENVFASTICAELSLITDESNLPRLACANNGFIYEASRQAGIWTELTIIQSAGSQPDLTKDSSNNLHLVWSDSRSGVLDTFYSPTYSCEGISPATDAGIAVLGALENTDYLYYCKNSVEEIIYVPAKNEIEAFDEWENLASSAQYEVAFTVMFWDKDNGSELPVPGEDVLDGIQQLYEEVSNEENENKYPHGMNVRILLGVQFNTINLDSPAPGTDQRFNVLEQIQELDIPIYETLSNGREWKVEVALYDFGLGSGLPPGIHSHVKLMVVDNNKMIVSGYHPQYGFQTVDLDAKNHDLGIKVSGPIAANGMAVFDSLWEGSEILCTEEDVALFDIIILIGWGSCHTKIGENPTHWFFVPTGDDIALPLYRDHYDKTADKAIEAAILSAETSVYVFQNRVGVPPVFPGAHLNFDVPTYKEDGLLEYASALLSASDNAEIHIIVSQDFASSFYNNPSMINFLNWYSIESSGNQGSENLIRFFNPNQDNIPGLHAKAFLIDENFLVIGSQNFDHSAFGINDEDLDLVEYSLGIEGEITIEETVFSNTANYIKEQWDKARKTKYFTYNTTLETNIQQANPGDVILLEPGVYEISSTLNIPEEINIYGVGATIIPAQNFSSESPLKLASPSLQTTPAPLMRITGDNVSLIGLTLQDSSGYAIEVEDNVENAYISNIVFENNALGGVYVQNDITYTIENNTFISGGSGVTIASNVNATGLIRNNIFTEQTIAPIEITSPDDGTVEYSYNLFDNCGLGACTSYWHIGDLSASSTAHDNLFDVDPLFVNPSNGEYQLLANSPAIDAGDPSILHEFLFDGDGDDELRIDIGAHEYMGELSNEPTPTPTPTQTPTETPTPTVTPTFTPSPTNTLTFTPSPTFTPVSDLIFADSFESGNFTAWDWATTDGGDLSVSTQSAAVGTYGMQALLDDSAEILVYDHTPNNEIHYSARFYFDPNDVQSPNDGFYLMALSSNAGWVGCVYFEQQGNDYYSLNLCGRNDAGTWLETESVLIADEWQAVEIEWKAATSSGANNGYIKLYIGDELAASIENIDNDTHSITTTSLGILDTPAGASGTVYFDEFESRTGSHIGLHPNAPSVNSAPTRPDALFSDDFEGNNLNAWNPTLTKIDFGDLSTSSGSAYQSNYGLQALIDDIVVLRAVDSSPADESQYRARFYFHPNSLTMNNNTAHFIFDGYDTDAGDYLFRLELFYENGSYKLRPRIMKDNYATVNGSKYTISNAWHAIEIEWKKATAVGANDGYLSLWIDGTLVGTIANVDNDLWTLDFAQLGATASIDSTTSGSMLFDNFVSRRFTYIGQ